MKRLLAIILILALLSVPTMALGASIISGARYYGVIQVSNNSTAETFVATTTGASINTTNLIAGGYLNAEADNCVIRTSSGADIPFMPGYTTDNYPWCIWVNSIGADTYLSDILYTANSSGGEIRYFPGLTGMTTPDNDATLELGDNFTVEQKGWVDTTFTVVYEDFTTYTEVDPNNKLTVTANKALGADVDADEGVYLYRDMGVDYFDSIDIDFEIYIESTSEDDCLAGTAVTNTIGTVSDLANTDITVWIRRTLGPVYTIYLARGNGVASDTYVCAADTPYWCSLLRATGSDSAILDIYTDSARTVLVDTLVLAGYGAATKYQYVYGFINNNPAIGDRNWDGYVQNLELVITKYLVNKEGAFKTYISGTENITSTIISGNSVVATGVSSGEHTVRTTTANYTDDFSVDLWTDVGAGVGVDITDSRMEWDVINGLNIYSSMPIPAVSDVSWELLLTYRITTAGAGLMGFGLLETPADVGTATDDALLMVLNNMNIHLRAWDEGAVTTSGVSAVAVDTTYYITFRRVSAILAQFWIYTDPERTVLHASQALAIPAGIVGLDNLEVSGYAGGAAQTVGWIDDMTNPTQSFLRIFIDDSLEDVAFGASVPDTGIEWRFMENNSMPYAGSDNGTMQQIWIDGIMRQHIVWEYDDEFTDLSVNGNPATPSFRVASSDPHVSAKLISFQPISEAQAPDYVLGEAPDFIDPGITGNVTGNFTTAITPTAGAFPLAEVIIAIAQATDTPAQLPLLIIAAFVILAASLAVSATMRRYGSGSLIVKIMVIAGFMGIFVALGNFAIDFWMIVVFLIIGIALAFASKQLGWS